jgi:Lipase (class 3)
MQADECVEFVHLYDIAKDTGGDVIKGGLDKRATYFWSHAAYCSNVELISEMPDVFSPSPSSDTAWHKLSIPGDPDSPRVLVYQSPHARILSIMGTKRSVDLKAIMRFTFDKSALMRQIEASYDTVFKSVPQSDMLLEIVLEYLDRLPRRARVHPGIYLRAYQALNLIWQQLDSVPTTKKTNLFLYGHSLGAACATLTFVWLREIYIKGKRDTHGALDLKCGCLACPMFCDVRAWQEWFHTTYSASASSTLDDHRSSSMEEEDDQDQAWSANSSGVEDGKWLLDGSYRHYYTDGDIFVKEIPALAGYTRAFSNTHYVCPDTTGIVTQNHANIGNINRLLLPHSSLQETKRQPVRVYIKLPLLKKGGRPATTASINRQILCRSFF